MAGFTIASKHGIFEVLIDDEDLDKVSKHRWFICYTNSKYTKYYRAEANIKRKKIKLHRFILNITDKNISIDHIDNNPLNNKKENLRICTTKQNQANRKLSKNSTSGYKGVAWHKQAKKWRAYIVQDNSQIFLGLYENKIDAANAYNKKAKELFGNFAKLNSITGEE